MRKFVSTVRAGVVLMLAAAVAPAAAQVQSQRSLEIDQCANTGDKYTPDQVISACTAHIEWGRSHSVEKAVAWAYDARGNAWEARGNHDRAFADYDQAIRLGSITAYLDRGDAWRAKGDFDRAIADYSQSIQLHPDNPDVRAVIHFLRGLAWKDKGDLDRAMADFNEVIRLSPKYAQAYYERGLIKQRKNDQAGGDADIAAARGIDPKIGK